MDDEKSLKEHFCVNSNACDICRKVFPVMQEVDEKKNIFQKKRDRRGIYFVPHITWQA